MPELLTRSEPVPAFAETMLVPGAARSGLSPASPRRGPRELKLATGVGRMLRRRYADGTVCDGGSAGDQLDVAVVARRGNDDHAGQGGVVGGRDTCVVLGAVGRSQRKVYHIQMIAKVAILVRIDRPLQRQVRQVGAAVTAEDLEGIDACPWGYTGTDVQLTVIDSCVVWACVRRAGIGDAAAGGRAGYMRAMAIAVHRIGIGVRNVLAAAGGGGIVIVACKIIATDHPWAGKPRYVADARPIVLRVARPRPAKIAMEVVDPRIGDGDAHTLAVQSARCHKACGGLPQGRYAEKGNTRAVAGLLGDE